MLKKLLFIPDTHIPYHDKRAWRLAMIAAKAFKPDTIIIGGDFGDFYSVSSHSKQVDRMNKFDYELKQINKALDQVCSIGTKDIHFVEGNHEDRLRRYLQDKAPELAGQLDTKSLFKLKKRGISFTPYKSTLKLGKLHVTHDFGNAGRFAHYKALDTAQQNVVINHTHRIGYAVEGSNTGKRYVTAMFGWLGDLNSIDYMHRDKANKDWSLGLGTGYLDTDTGYVYLVPIPMVEYTVMIEGKLYKG